MKTLQHLMEMAKRSTPDAFYELLKKKYGSEKVKALKWPEIVAVSKENEVLIPPYIRDAKVGRGTFNGVPPDHADAKATKVPSDTAVKAAVSRMVDTAMKDSVPVKPKEYKMPPVTNKWYDSDEWSQLYRDMKAKFGEFELKRVPYKEQRHGPRGVMLGISLLVNKKTDEVMGYWETTGASMVPGRGFVTYGGGQISTGEKPKETPKPVEREKRPGGKATEAEMRAALEDVKSAMRNATRGTPAGSWQTWGAIEKDGKGYMFDVRDWGYWEGDDGSGDYDFQELSKGDSKKMNDIIEAAEQRHKNVKLAWQTGEKNWIYVTAR